MCDWDDVRPEFAKWLAFPDDYHLMQFTGLKDKNGIEIYEGDIVRLHCSGKDGATSRHKVTATIIWMEQSAAFLPLIHDKEVVVQGGSAAGKVKSFRTIHSWGGMHSCFSFSDYTEVIGNVYENPELTNNHET